MANNIVDDFMGFESNSLDIFNEKPSYEEPNIYKTTPKLSKSDDGNYHAKVRIILNPTEPKKSIINQTNYWIDQFEGKRSVRSSLSINDTSCPIFQCFQKHWKIAKQENDDKKQAFLREIFSRSESKWVLVQILEDNNQPQCVGKFMYMKLSRDSFDKLSELMNPSADSGKQPYPVMDYLIGMNYIVNVKPGPDDPANPERKQRETSYSLCGFEDYSPIIKEDGTNLFTDDEIEIIETYHDAFNDSRNGKTQKKRDEATKKLEEIRTQIRGLYSKAIEYVRDYMRTNNLDLEKDCGYQPWDELLTEFVNHFVDIVNAGMDPRTTAWNLMEAEQKHTVKETAPIEETPTEEKQDDDLPF